MDYNNKIKKLSKTAVKIVVIYFILGVAWIFISDSLLTFLSSNLKNIIYFQYFKGIFYVILTSVLLYTLIKFNINEMLKVNSALHDSEERYRLAVEGSNESPWYRILENDEFFSSNLHQILVMSVEESPRSKKEYDLLVHPNDFEMYEKYINNYLNGNAEYYKAEYRLRAKNGDYKWIFSRGKVIRDKNGKPIRFDGFHSDITARKIIEEQLKKTSFENKRLYEEVLQYDKLKTEFFSNISHELKTPLTVIFSTVQLIDLQYKSGKIIDKTNNLEKRISMLKQNCYRFLRLINNIMDITRIDSGYLDPNYKEYNIVSLIEEISMSVAQYIQDTKAISLEFDTNIEEKIIACDVDKIERIMLNLLSNAVKFTPVGGKICVNLYDKGETIIISVKDNGIGIPKEMQSVIFERFRQVDSSLTRSKEGSGVGLSLVKSLVEILGGTISVKSIVGKGSEFIVELPANHSSQTPEKPKECNPHNYVERINMEFSDIYSNDAV